MLDGHGRIAVERVTAPVGAFLALVGVTANQLTVVGLVAAVGASVAIATNRLFLGAALLGVSALPDLFDGPVAKAAGTSSARGAFFDSVADRVTDTVVLGGLAWYLESSRGGHAAMLAFALLGASILVSYQRAKAESLGYRASGGLMERAERVVALAVGLVFSAVLVPVLWATLVLTAITAVQRFAKVWRQGPQPSPAAAPPMSTAAAPPMSTAAAPPMSTAAAPRVVAAWRPGRVESRWRAWREEAVARSERASQEGPVGSSGASRRTGAPAGRWRTGAPAGRWRARRQGALSGRSTGYGRSARASASRSSAPRERTTGAWRRRIDSDS